MAEYADEMLVMHEGELIAKGETHAVLSDLSMLKKEPCCHRQFFLHGNWNGKESFFRIYR